MEEELQKMLNNPKFMNMIYSDGKKWKISEDVISNFMAKQTMTAQNLIKSLFQALFDPIEFKKFSSSGKKGKKGERKPEIDPRRKSAIIGKCIHLLIRNFYFVLSQYIYIYIFRYLLQIMYWKNFRTSQKIAKR